MLLTLMEFRLGFMRDMCVVPLSHTSAFPVIPHQPLLTPISVLDSESVKCARSVTERLFASFLPSVSCCPPSPCVSACLYLSVVRVCVCVLPGVASSLPLTCLITSPAVPRHPNQPLQYISLNLLNSARSFSPCCSSTTSSPISSSFLPPQAVHHLWDSHSSPATAYYSLLPSVTNNCLAFVCRLGPRNIQRNTVGSSLGSR